LINLKPRCDFSPVPPAPSSPLSGFRKTAIVAALRKSRMFSDLSPADIEAIADGCTVRTLAKDETLFREGEKADGFYVAQTGRISIYRLTPDGREQIICVFQPPESFAEVVMSTVETYPANAMALEPSQVIVIHKKHFRELVCQKPELALHMLASMSLHLKHLVQTIHDMKGKQIEGRLAEWLLQHSPDSDGAKSFTLPVSKKNLAAQLGVTSETFSRTLARFRREGLIEVAGPQLQLINRPGLRAYVEV
jgi:CRP/FNR family transcriptional regulator, dissimilatory nitrate respiration regulator